VRAKYRVSFSKAAETDAEEIWTYIAASSRENATRFVQHLEEHVRTLEHFPERCPLIKENAIWGTSYRHLIEGDYRVIFRIVRKSVHIVRLVRASRLISEESILKTE
jgi:toxin ParE1/3/4